MAVSVAGDGQASVPAAAGDELTEVGLDELRTRPAPDNLPLPTKNPDHLPLGKLEPEVFERLVAELVTLNRTSVHFYGRRGQRQYGLDIVEQQDDSTRVLYQVKRYARASDLDLRATLVEYAGPSRKAGSDEPPRRFDPTRFVVVLSAPFDDDTANVDTLAEIQNEYRGDLQVDVWGAERVSRELRRAVEVVYAMFGEAWAREWCGDDSVAEARRNAENRRRIITILNTAMSVQYDEDDNVRFRQIALMDVSVDSLFVDVPVTADADSPTEDLLQQINPTPSAATNPATAPPLAGAAQVLLHPDWSGSAVIVGGPGQGKSTLLQYLCQHHRARLLDRPHYSPIAAGLEPVTQVVRAPLRIDLNDYAEWRREQLGSSSTETVSGDVPQRRGHDDQAHAGLVPYLAAVVQQTSGQPFTADDLAVSLTSRPMLIALDGLDEVADPDDREKITAEIRRTESRLRTTAQNVCLLVATRPGNVSDPIWRSSQFVTLFLTHLTDPLRMKYLDRWTAQSKLTAREKTDLRKTFAQNIVTPHVRELAGSPMQLAILLHLMQRREVLPEKRTILYERYIDVFMDRESPKLKVAGTHKDLVIKFHKLLAWHIHTQVELGLSTGTVNMDELLGLLTAYLTPRGYDATFVDELFKSVTGRVLCLVERDLGSGEFEFEVQPLREYFAAEHAYDVLPGDTTRNTRQACLGALLRRPYWSNVTRFYAGRFTSGEVPAIIFQLQHMQEDKNTGCHPLSRVIAKLLLDDQVLAGQLENTLGEMVRVILHGPGQVFALDGLIHQAEAPLTFTEHGGAKQAAEVLLNCLTTETAPADSAAELMRRWGSTRPAAKSWWTAIDRLPADRWLDVAAKLDALSGLTPDQQSRAEALLIGLSPDTSVLDLLVASRSDLVTDALVDRCLRELKSGHAQRNLTDRDCHYGRLVFAADPQRFYDHRRAAEADRTAVAGADAPPPRPRTRPARLQTASVAWNAHVDALNAAHSQRGTWTTVKPWYDMLDQASHCWTEDCWPIREALFALPDFAAPVGVEAPDLTTGAPWRVVAAWLAQAAAERGNPTWWLQQANLGDDPLASLTFVVAGLTLASSGTVQRLSAALDERLAALAPAQWAAASDAVRRYAQNVPAHRHLNVSDALRVNQMTPSARLSILMWPIAASSTRTRLCPLIASDLPSLWNHGLSVRAALQEFVVMHGKPLDASSLHGARHDLPLSHLRPAQIKSIPQPLAEQILKEPQAWPTAVVRRAADRVAARLEKLPPVAVVATRDKWGV